MGFARTPVGSHRAVEAPGISAHAITEGLHPQVRRKGTPFGYSDHVGPSHASAVFAGTGTGVRRNKRSELLWVPDQSCNSGRHVSAICLTIQKGFGPMGVRGRYQRVLRPYQPRLARAQCPDGQSDPAEMAESWRGISGSASGDRSRNTTGGYHFPDSGKCGIERVGTATG